MINDKDFHPHRWARKSRSSILPDGTNINEQTFIAS